MNNINLLDYKSKSDRKKLSTNLFFLRLIAISVMFLTAAVSISFFILILLSPLPELERQQNAASQTLSQSINDIIKLELVKNRASSTREIIDQRKSFESFINYLQTIASDSVNIEKLNVSDKEINITFESSSLVTLENFISEISSNQNIGVEYSRIDLPRIIADSNNNVFKAELDIKL